MIQINKFENIFGIKRWQNLSGKSFNTLNVFYAPNGTAKTSFADGLEAIANGQSPQGVFPGDKMPNFEIEIDGKTATIASPNQFCILSFKGGQMYPLTDEVSGQYLLPPKSQSKIDKYRDIIQNSIDFIRQLTAKYFPKARTDKFAEFINVIYGSSAKNPLVEFMEKEVFLNRKFPFSLTPKEVETICSSSTMEIAAHQIEPSLFKKYHKALRKVSRDSFLDKDFDIEHFERFLGDINKKGYFSDKRKLKLGKYVVDEEKAQGLLQKKKQKIFSNPQIISLSDEILAAFSKKANSDVRAVFISHPELISLLNKPKDLMVRSLLTLLEDTDINLLVEKQDLVRSSLKSLSYLLNDKNISLDEANKVWERFKMWFHTNSYDISITKRFDSLIGYDIPLIQKVYPNTNVEIPQMNNRLSEGEKKTFFLINLILQIETKRKRKEPFVLIFDDVVDSFDYKNKYAFLQYLSEMANNINNKEQIFILTHSFDFYCGVLNSLRSVPHSERFTFSNDVSSFFLVNKEGVVDVLSADALVRLTTPQGLNEWKDSKNGYDVFAYLCFFRGLCEMKGDELEPFNPYFHYIGNNTEMKKLNQLLLLKQNLYADNALYLDCLLQECDSIVAQDMSEVDLSKKICLALGIRILREKYLILYADEHGIKYSQGPNRMNIINKLEKRVFKDFGQDSDECRKLLAAKIVSNPNVHVNGLVFEPIVDIGVDSLLSSYRDMKALTYGLDCLGDGGACK